MNSHQTLVAKLFLEKYDVTYKVDTSATCFDSTAKNFNKFITIYPPASEDKWNPLLEKLEKVLGRSIECPPTELPVGKYGGIGMRHGQLTALDLERLQLNNIACANQAKNGSKNGTNPDIQLANSQQYDTTLRDGELLFRNGAYFGYYIPE